MVTARRRGGGGGGGACGGRATRASAIPTFSAIRASADVCYARARRAWWRGRHSDRGNVPLSAAWDAPSQCLQWREHGDLDDRMSMAWLRHFATALRLTVQSVVCVPTSGVAGYGGRQATFCVACILLASQPGRGGMGKRKTRTQEEGGETSRKEDGDKGLLRSTVES